MLISEKLDDGFASHLTRILLTRPQDENLIIFASRLLVKYDQFNDWCARFAKAHLSVDQLLEILDQENELEAKIVREIEVYRSTGETERLKEKIEDLYVYLGELFDRYAHVSG
jgi:hypothetical protein